MRVVFIINSLEKGGAERVVLTLLNFIPKTSTTPVYLFLLEDNIAYKIPQATSVFIGSNYHRSNFIKLLKIPLLALRLKKFCKKNQITTVMSLLERSNFTNVIARFLGSDHYCILSERNTPSLVYQSQHLKDRINRQLIRWLYPKSDQIITLSDGVRLDLNENFGIRMDMLKTIYNPYDIESIQQKSKEEIELQWLTNNSYQTILNVASLTRQKAHDVLLKTFARLSRQNKKLRLIIIGSGPKHANLLALANELGIQQYVKFTGLVENPYTYMARADVFVLSSAYEGFGNVLVEAMICGCPVVSTDCRWGPNEIIKNRHNGVLVPVGDLNSISSAIKDILEDKLFRQKLIKNALESCKKYRVNKIAAEFLDVINNYAEISGGKN